MKQILETYHDKYAIWTQLAGLICFFGAVFVFILERPLYDGWPILSISMFVYSVIIFVVNMVIDDTVSGELHRQVEQKLQEKISKGDLPPENLEMFRRLFK